MTLPSFIAQLGGTPYTNWTSVSVSRSLERMAGEFNIELKRKDKDIFLNNAITPGTEVKILIDGNLVLDGWIDQVKFQGDATNETIVVSGRDKTGDLIDCAARVSDTFDFLNQKLDAVVKKVIAPFNLKLTVTADVGAAFPRLAVQPGETAFEFIERTCRFRQLMIVSDGIGGVVLVQPHNEQSPGQIIYGQNVIARNVDVDEKEVFSLYVVKGHAEPLANDPDNDTDAGTIARQEARATDTLVKRYRPKVIVSENQGYTITLQQRANWEKKNARARSRKATYTVNGWYAAGKTLWKPNSVVKVTDAPAGINRNMLIIGATFTLTADQACKTVLDLALPEAFDLPAIKGPKNNNIWAADND